MLVLSLLGSLIFGAPSFQPVTPGPVIEWSAPDECPSSEDLVLRFEQLAASATVEGLSASGRV